MKSFQILSVSICFFLLIQLIGIWSASIEKGLDVGIDNPESNNVEVVSNKEDKHARVRRQEEKKEEDLYDGDYPDDKEEESKEAELANKDGGTGDSEKKKFQSNDGEAFPPDCGFLYKIEEIIKTRGADSGAHIVPRMFVVLGSATLAVLALKF